MYYRRRQQYHQYRDPLLTEVVFELVDLDNVSVLLMAEYEKASIM